VIEQPCALEPVSTKDLPMIHALCLVLSAIINQRNELLHFRLKSNNLASLPLDSNNESDLSIFRIIGNLARSSG
jgi:hypothetical protein